MIPSEIFAVTSLSLPVEMDTKKSFMRLSYAAILQLMRPLEQWSMKRLLRVKNWEPVECSKEEIGILWKMRQENAQENIDGRAKTSRTREIVAASVG